jgi:hypothetical protein
MTWQKLTDRLHDPFTLGDPSVAIHAATCGTSTVHVGHCHLDCGCWCHGDRDRPGSDV